MGKSMLRDIGKLINSLPQRVSAFIVATYLLQLTEIAILFAASIQ